MLTILVRDTDWGDKMEVGRICNNGGILTVYLKGIEQPVEVFEKRTEKDGCEFYYAVTNLGTVDYGCKDKNGKWWSSSSTAINDVFQLEGTEHELAVGSFSYNLRVCGVLKSKLDELDKENKIYKRFERLKEENRYGEEELEKLTFFG